MCLGMICRFRLGEASRAVVLRRRQLIGRAGRARRPPVVPAATQGRVVFYSGDDAAPEVGIWQEPVEDRKGAAEQGNKHLNTSPERDHAEGVCIKDLLAACTLCLEAFTQTHTGRSPST